MIIPGTISSKLPQPPATSGSAPMSAIPTPAATPARRKPESPRSGSRWIARVSGSTTPVPGRRWVPVLPTFDR